MFQTEQLNEKWQPVLEHADLPEIKDTYKRAVTTVILENQEKAFREDNNLQEAAPTNATGSNVANWDPVLISLVRRAMPSLIAYDVAGVQPMTGPTGLIFAMKSRYTTQGGTEALFNEPDTDFTGAGTHAGTDPSVLNDTSPGTFTGGTGMATATGEALGDASGNYFPEMAFSIESTSVTAKTRALKAEYTMELAHDLKAIHGLDAESELASILSSEIIAETNWEVIDRMNTLAKSSLIGKPGSGDDGDVYDFATVNVEKAGVLPGAVGGSFKYLNSRNEQVLTTAGYKTVADLATTDQLVLHSNNIDLNDFAHNGGARWAGEKYKSLIMQINKEANIIARETGRGRGNFLIVSADIAAALDMTSALAVPSVDGNAGNNDITQNLFAGVLGGKYKVFVDPYAGDNTILIGYKGAKEMDAGMFYCPYVPLQMMKAQGEEDFQPRIGFKSRYGLINNPFAGGQDLNFASAAEYAGNNPFYRKFSVSGI